MNKFIVIGASTLFLAGCGTSASIDMNTSIAINQTQKTEAPLKLIVDGETVLPSLPPFSQVIRSMYLQKYSWSTILLNNDGIVLRKP